MPPLVIGLPVLLVIATALSVAFVLRPVAAWICPICYGLERTEPLLFVDRAMPPEVRTQLAKAIAEAKTHVAEFYGSPLFDPIIVACSSPECDRRLGGRGAHAVNFSGGSFAVIHLSPRGLHKSVISHELSHVQAHQRVGIINLLRGKLPAWFDEGLAVIVAEGNSDEKHGALASASERCTRSIAGDLPENFRKWGKLARRTPVLYSDAACEVRRWMDANAGKAGLLSVLDAVGRGERRLP